MARRKQRLIYDMCIFSEGLAAVGVNGKYGFIDAQGQVAIPLKYDDVAEFRDGLAPVELNGKWGFIDTNGSIVIPCMYSYVEAFKENGLACVELNGKMGCIDRAGREVVPLKYDCVGNHVDMLTVELDEKWGLMDLDGNLI